MSYLQHRPIRQEPQWRPVRQCPGYFLPSGHRPWLLDDGSLTNHLIQASQGQFRVQRLSQDWQVPLASERQLLELPHRQRALVREVVLEVRGEAAVFARSVFPASSLEGSLRHLRRLENRSLGSILFHDPGMHRSPFELALMPGNSDYLPAQLQQTSPAWGRRSRFNVAGVPLMVSEVFLTPFKPWNATLPVHRSQRGRVDPENLAAKQ